MLQYKKMVIGVLGFMSLMMSSVSYASCSGIMGRSLTGYDYGTAGFSGIGRINISSNYLQPVGSILGTGISNYANIRVGPLSTLSDEGVILTCTSQADKAKLKWAHATNGDSVIGGFYEIPGHPGFYATDLPYVAVKLTFADTGEVLSRFWSASSMTVQTEDLPNGGFVVKKKHIPKVIATVMKWSDAYAPTKDANGNSPTAAWCVSGAERGIPTAQTSNPDQKWWGSYYAANGLNGGCGQPNGYLNLLGTGGYEVNVGQDSNLNYLAWDYSIPIGLSGPPAVVFSYSPSCVVRNNTPVVSFPTVSADVLAQGGSVSQDFSVTLECDQTISTNVTPSSVAVGFQPSLKAFNHAKSLGLIDPRGGGVTYLVSDDYGENGMATGVGIKLKNGSGEAVNFFSWDGCTPTIFGYTSYCPAYEDVATMRRAGWDPVMSGGSTEVAIDAVNATRSYRKPFTATLEALPGLVPKAGKVKAIATIYVRLP